jgi:hypothetical protein
MFEQEIDTPTDHQMKILNKYKLIEKQNQLLFQQGKISYYDSAENMQVLHNIVESRRNRIEKAAKQLGIEF